MRNTPCKTLRELAQNALDVQNACNLTGVLLSAHRDLCDLRDVLKLGTDDLNGHPIAILWADKIASLTGTQAFGNDGVETAYKAVYAILEGEVVS